MAMIYNSRAVIEPGMVKPQLAFQINQNIPQFLSGTCTMRGGIPRRNL
jgi:hypothetical protein